MQKALSDSEVGSCCPAVNEIFRISFLYITGFIVFLSLPAGALHYDRDAVSFTTVEELFSPGKELKVWSDTAVRIMGISFTHHESGISWQYAAGRSIPCTLSVGDTLDLKLSATYIRKADNPVLDSVAITTGPGQFNYLPLHVAAFPHTLITTNTVIGPVADNAAKCLFFGRDSVYCTLRHKVSYSFVWDDGFRSFWTDARTATHSWSVAGQYGVRVLARCQEYLYADTVQTYPVTISPVMLNVAPGAYKSGFFAREVGGKELYPIDFSEIGSRSPRDSDVVFNNGYFFTAPHGLLSLGIYDSLPGQAAGSCGRAVPETSTVCMTLRQAFDSLVGSQGITCPSVMPDTVMRMNVGQFCIVKTTEGNYGLLIKIGEYIGGIDWEYYYWGYQSDGAARLYPGGASGTDSELPYRKESGEAVIKCIQRGKNMRLAVSDGRSVKEIAVFTCNGSLVRRQAFNGTENAALESDRLSKGVYVVFVRTATGIFRRLVHLY